MSLAKKISKFQKNPQVFFTDSKKPLMKMIGNMMQNTPEPTKVENKVVAAKPAVNPAKAKNASVPVKNSQKSIFDQVRSMQSGFSNENDRIDLWRIYREAVKKDDGQIDAEHRFDIYPIGIPLLDKSRERMYQEDGCATFFLPLWEDIEQFSDLDDFEYLANKSPLLANSVAKRLLDIAILKKATAILLPYDATAVTRAIAIQSRALGIITICHFPSYSPMLQLYADDRLTAFPICDWIAIDEKFAGHLNFPEAVMRRCALISDQSEKYESPMLITEAKRNQLRFLMGVGAVEDIRIIALPPLQSVMTNENIISITFEQINNLFSRIQPTDHLLIIAKRRKNGFLNGDAIKLIQSKYRKTILFYDDGVELADLLSIAREAIVPVGLLPQIYYDNNIVNAYNFDVADSLDIDEALNSSLEVLQEVTPAGFKHPGFDKLGLPKTNAELIGLPLNLFDNSLNRILDRDGPGLGVIAVPDPVTNLPITNGRQKYLLELINANKRVSGANLLQEANMAEVFVQWGAEPSESKERPEVFRSLLSRPRLFLEDGFIRSKGLWTDPNEPTLSVIMDTRAIYYNSLQPSLLETILNSDFQLSRSQLERARVLIDKIVGNKISKYNHAPVLTLDFCIPGKKAILLIDQKVGDMSIKYGSATDESFSSMLQAALDLGDDVEIIIKQHPCAISGGADEAHFTADSLGPILRNKNIHLIGFDVNPYSLINAVDEVWVVSSGMGFEALMAGKSVRCFGGPFYAQWGVTHDEVTLDRRTRHRSIEEIFYIFYVILSRYIDPETGKSCEVERLVEYFSGNEISPK